MSLMSAIDALLAFVDEFDKALALWHKTPGNVRAWNEPVPSTYPCFDVDECEAVSRTVFLEAAEIGLDGRLPSKDTSAFEPNGESLAFVGQTNLPGTWFLDVGFVPMPTRHWRDAMLTLRALGEKADAAKGEPPTDTPSGEGGKPPVDPFAELRQFAREKLKGKEGAVIEALCDAGGELPITALALKKGVGWENAIPGFTNAQRRLKSKLHRRGWALERHDNSARLVKKKARPKTVQKDGK